LLLSNRSREGLQCKARSRGVIQCRGEDLERKARPELSQRVWGEGHAQIIKHNKILNLALMSISAQNKEILIYGVSMAVVLLVLKWIETHFIVFNYRLEIFVGLIALLFTVLGVWLALKLMKPKVETKIVEKEIYIETGPRAEINQKEIEKLGISKRELDVLHLMATGASNEEIAEKLFVSLNTVKTHSSNIFLKLDVKRRTQAIEKAKRLNIIH
jgi:DNA-binding CsgD family transcriptional regulator